jgi:hypothetical protein
MKITLLHWLLFAVSLSLTGFAHAEGVCLPGYYPTGASQGQAGPQGCAPITGYNQQQQQIASPPRPLWADRYGAIAIDPHPFVPGASFNQPSRGDAEQAAIAECKSFGGLNCNVEISSGNECVILAVGKTGHNAKAGLTIESATQSAMKICDAADTGCFAFYTACGPAVRIR